MLKIKTDVFEATCY